MRDLFSLSPNELAILTTALAIEMVKGKSVKENIVLGNLLVALGGVILTIATQQDLLESRFPTAEDPAED